MGSSSSKYRNTRIWLRDLLHLGSIHLEISAILVDAEVGKTFLGGNRRGFILGDLCRNSKCHTYPLRAFCSNVTMPRPYEIKQR